MKRLLGYCCVLLSSAGSIGCVDTVPAVLRDGISTRNELGDILLQANDEESANSLAKSKLEPLKKKWEAIANRSKISKDMDAKQKAEAADFMLRQVDELTESDLRVAEAVDRLKEIRLQLALQEYAKQRAEGFTADSMDPDTYSLLNNVSDSVRDELRQTTKPLTAPKENKKSDDPPSNTYVGGMKGGSRYFIDCEQLCPGLTALIKAPASFSLLSLWGENPWVKQPPRS